MPCAAPMAGALAKMAACFLGPVACWPCAFVQGFAMTEPTAPTSTDTVHAYPRIFAIADTVLRWLGAPSSA